MAPAFAFVLQDQIEQYGAYLGIVAFLGLAVVIVLNFAQAREIKRLREQMAASPADPSGLDPAQRAAAGPVLPQRTPAEAAAARVPAAAASGRVPAATAAARGTTPTGAAATPSVEGAAAGDATQVPVASGAAAAGAGGAPVGGPRIPTPPARPRTVTPPRTVPPAGVVPPRHRAAAAGSALREEDPEEVSQGGRGLRLALITLVVVLVAAGAVVGGILVLGGDPSGGTAGTRAVDDPASTPVATATPKRSSVASQRKTTGASILNGTQTAGLAATAVDKLTGAGYLDTNLGRGNATDKTVQTSTVYYADGKRAIAVDIGKQLGITDFAPLTTDLQVAASPPSGRSPVAVVMLGADKVSG